MDRIFTVPKFLSAPSPQELVRAMLLNNSKSGKGFRYFDIQFANKQWIAWYYDEAETNFAEEIKKALNNGSKRNN